MKRWNLHVGEYDSDRAAMTPEMKAFLELEDMLVPVSQDLDYDEELAEARNEKYGRLDWGCHAELLHRQDCSSGSMANGRNNCG